MRTPQAAHLEMNTAYPEFKKVRCDLQVLLTAGSYRTRGRVAKSTKREWGRSVQAGYPEVESYTMSAGLTTPIDYGLGHACKPYSELSFRLSPSSKSVKLRICLNQSGFGSVGPNQCSVSRFTRSSSKGSIGSIGRGSAARLSSFSIFCGCSMSSIEMAEPQCAQIESVARLIDAPQLEQFTV